MGVERKGQRRSKKVGWSSGGGKGGAWNLDSQFYQRTFIVNDRSSPPEFSRATCMLQPARTGCGVGERDTLGGGGA